jgi:hypothetical protein
MSKKPTSFPPKSGLWGAPTDDRKPRSKRRLENPDVFFTLKVYSQVTDRKDRSLKFTLDFNPPFQATTNQLEPFYVTPLLPENVTLFEEILTHVVDIYKYVADPVNYNVQNAKLTPEAPNRRREQQEHLKQILELTKGRISQIFYEQASANMVGVSAVALSDGNGDARPPKRP